MEKRFNELNSLAESLPFDATHELFLKKGAYGCFPAFEEAIKEIDALLKHECSHLEAKFEINKIIETTYNEAFLEGLMVGYKEGQKKVEEKKMRD